MSLAKRIKMQHEESKKPKQEDVTTHPAVSDIKLGAGQQAAKKKVYKY